MDHQLWTSSWRKQKKMSNIIIIIDNNENGNQLNKKIKGFKKTNFILFKSIFSENNFYLIWIIECMQRNDANPFV